MFEIRSARLMVALIACLGFSACATHEDETAVDRRVFALEEDNASLKKQIEDLNSVENALNRELTAKKNAESRSMNGVQDLRSENEGLRTSLAKLRADLQEAQAMKGSERPVAEVETNGLKGRNIEIIERSDGRVAVRVAGMTMFKTAQASLTSSGKKVLNRIGRFLKERPDLQVSVEGHTDATPLGKTKAIWGTNLGLSLARAMAVQDYLSGSQGVAENRMCVVGHGEHKPVMAGKSKAANAKNRRVEIVLYAKDN